jgi:hypothetical protein
MIFRRAITIESEIKKGSKELISRAITLQGAI